MRGRFVRTIGSLLLLAGMQSCVTDNYDFDKDLETKFTFSPNGFTLGGDNSADIPLSQVINLKEDGQLTTDASGNYLFLKKATDVKTSTITVANNNDVCGKVVRRESFSLASVCTVRTGGSTSGRRVGTDGLKSFDLKAVVTPEFSTVPQDASVKELKTVQTNMVAQVSIKFSNVTGFQLGDDFVIVLPSFYVVDESALTDGKLKLTADEVEKLQNLQTVVKEVAIREIDFNAENLQSGEVAAYNPETREIELKGNVTVTGTIYLPNTIAEEITGGVSGSAALAVNTTIDKVTAESVTGRFDKTEDLDITPIEMKNIPDFLLDDEVYVDLENPVLKLNLENEIPADVLMSATLESVRDGKVTATVNMGSLYGTDAIRFDAGTVGTAGENVKTVSTVWISNKALTAAELPQGENGQKVANVVVPTLSTLIEKIPDYIRINAVAQTDPSQQVTVALTKSYTATPDYELEAPLRMGKNMKIVYTKDAEDLNDLVKDVEVESLILTAQIKNKLPLDLDFEVIPLDENGDVIRDIVVVAPKTIAGTNVGGTPVAQAVECTLTNKEGTDGISKLERVQVKATAVTGEKLAGELLNENQNLRMEQVKVTLKGKAE